MKSYFRSRFQRSTASQVPSAKTGWVKPGQDSAMAPRSAHVPGKEGKAPRGPKARVAASQLANKSTMLAPHSLFSHSLRAVHLTRVTFDSHDTNRQKEFFNCIPNGHWGSLEDFWLGRIMNQLKKSDEPYAKLQRIELTTLTLNLYLHHISWKIISHVLSPWTTIINSIVSIVWVKIPEQRSCLSCLAGSWIVKMESCREQWRWTSAVWCCWNQKNLHQCKCRHEV